MIKPSSLEVVFAKNKKIYQQEFYPLIDINSVFYTFFFLIEISYSQLIFFFKRSSLPSTGEMHSINAELAIIVIR